MATAALGLRRARRGSERGRFWRGEWSRGTEVRLQGRLGGSGGVRGDQGVIAVLGWLGGIPPSSLDARGEEDDRGRGGWAGWWAFAWATGKSFPIFCLIFPFFFLTFVSSD